MIIGFMSKLIIFDCCECKLLFHLYIITIMINNINIMFIYIYWKTMIFMKSLFPCSFHEEIRLENQSQKSNQNQNQVFLFID